MSHIQPDTHLPKTPKVKLYTILMLQSSTNDPTIITLKNTLGTIVWTRLNVGYYRGVLTNAFTVNKTFLSSSSSNNGNAGITTMTRVDASTIDLVTYNLAGAASDGVLNNCAIEIRVYES